MSERFNHNRVLKETIEGPPSVAKPESEKGGRSTTNNNNLCIFFKFSNVCFACENKGGRPGSGGPGTKKETYEDREMVRRAGSRNPNI